MSKPSVAGAFGGKSCECPAREVVCTDTRRGPGEKRYWFVCLVCKVTWQTIVELEDEGDSMSETVESEVVDG